MTNSTNSHYDTSVELFRTFLDPGLKYSSALFAAPDDDLAQAQTNKLHFIAQQLGVGPGSRVIDVGAGWGSLTCFLALNYGCEVTAITPAPGQCHNIAERAEGDGTSERITIEQGFVESLQLPERGFDAAALVGSIVHMPDQVAVLDQLRRALAPGGRLYVSESCFKNTAMYDTFVESAGGRYLRDDIFAGGDAVPLSRLVAAVEDAGFILDGLTDLTPHYKLTIDHWARNAAQNADRMEAIEPGASERYRRYFETANAGWSYTMAHYAVTAYKGRKRSPW